MTAQLSAREIEDLLNAFAPPRSLFYVNDVRSYDSPPDRFGQTTLIPESQVQSLLRQWLIAKGVPERKVLTASNYVLANAYRSGDSYIAKMKEEDSAKRFGKSSPRAGSGLRGIAFDPDTAAAIGSFMDPASPTAIEPSTVEPPTGASPPSPAPQIDAAAIARAADAVIRPRLDAAKAELFSSMRDVAQAAAREQLEALVLGENTKKTIIDLATSVATAVVEKLTPPRNISVTNTDGTVVTVGRQHEKFETLLRLVQARGHNNHRLNIWLTGPTGSGKTTAAEKVAEALAPTFKNYRQDPVSKKWDIINDDGTVVDLGLVHNGPFGADSSLDADYKLIGHKNAMGEFQWTTFLRVFCYGGVYVMDEIDNWLSSALVAANAPLANGWVSTPFGMMQRHPDCCIIACANTWGTGATNDYVGRAKLDAATLNRFPNKLYWPVDEKLERAIAHEMGGTKWCDIVQSARAAAKAQGLQVIFSPRNTFEGISLLNVGFTIEEVVEMNLMAGLKPEYVKTLGLDQIKTPQTESPKGTMGSDFNKECLFSDFRAAVNDGRKIDAIKLYREANSHRVIGLKDGKDLVEAIKDGFVPMPSLDQFLGADA